MSAFGAHSGTLNQELSIVGVVGTLGTSDEQGTARVLPFGVNPLTGGFYAHVLDNGGNSTNDYIIRLDEVASGTTYIGYAAPASSESSSVWKIKKMIETGGTLTTVDYAAGSATYTNPWSGRGTISYS